MTESRMQGFAAGRYAAIDIGTVTCRMLVADVDAAGAIHEVDREYAITNLGEGVDATGMLLPAAIDRTVETVEGYCAVRDRLAEQGAPIALEAFRFTGEMLGRALADVVTVTSPEAIFLFGGLSKAGKLIFEPTQWYMEENMLFVFKNKVKLLPSGIQGKNAAILGASALIWQEAAK